MGRHERRHLRQGPPRSGEGPPAPVSGRRDRLLHVRRGRPVADRRLCGDVSAGGRGARRPDRDGRRRVPDAGGELAARIGAARRLRPRRRHRGRGRVPAALGHAAVGPAGDAGHVRSPAGRVAAAVLRVPLAAGNGHGGAARRRLRRPGVARRRRTERYETSVRDRQLQQPSLRVSEQRGTMTEADGPADEPSGTGEPSGSDPGPDRDPTRRADVATLDDLDDLRQEIEAFEEEIEERTVHREDLESDLEQYVRWRVRRGHARGWGPYLVLLYGTAMTLGGFYFLSGVWAVLAMLVIWLSTLGLYALMVIVGIVTTTVGLPGRILDRLRNLR
ncbi:hypothetical protein BRD08_05785 [Halobacteriales archaeon SW_10_66_29]|nr:MAG: hypothetical protein BRD08_05785 [Halobacteriales archaeon SW_10_66_29]